MKVMKMVRVRFWMYLRQHQQDLLIKWMWNVREREETGMTPEFQGPGKQKE